MVGIINCFKPAGISSFSVVKYIKRLVSIKKIGHGGTLDPIAEGVLPVFIGKATRLIEYQAELPKVYRAEMVLGVRTDTQDKTGNIIEKKYLPMFTAEDIKSVFQEFTGTIEQIPPMFSAIKYKGKKLYELARKGIEVDRTPRKINTYNITLLGDYYEGNERVYFEVECSSGTYVRTLCEDMGLKLGCGAYLNSLLRVSSGSFHVDSSYRLEEIEEHYKNDSIGKIILSPDYALKHIISAIILPEFEHILLQGREVFLNYLSNKLDNLLSEQKVCIYNNKNNLIAISEVRFLENEEIYLKPLKVMGSEKK
ncbi:MAG TPA: tRNA pseudouridine(55) synthase TruB [Candidatus Eremiobacteraeota bacterium]|nr:MAG: tRNA pseudouridine synthase B [bacterium ADurb.Bin363]HPZ10031.1 tRNA pseudouridine(55) synthase TruB [Candidatus Eremiobacteraeota bacterium]